MPVQTARLAGQTDLSPNLPRAGEIRKGDWNSRRLRRVGAAGWLCKVGRVSPRGWAGAGLDAACRGFHHQRTVFTYHER